MGVTEMSCGPHGTTRRRRSLFVLPLLGRHEDTEDSTSDEDELHWRISTVIYETVDIIEGLKEFMDWI